MTKQTDYSSNFIAFYRDLCPVDYTDAQDSHLGANKPIMPPFMTNWLGLAFPAPLGAPVVRNIADFRSKKQGKSTLAAGVALYMATRHDYSEVVIAASDQDQSRDRVLRSAKYAVEHGPLNAHAKVFKDTIEFDNRSVIQAVPFDFRGAAGGNPDCVIFDELHAWNNESYRRMFDELLPSPTKPWSLRWMSSYAGFEGESLLLREWWDKGLKGERVSDELPLYLNQDAGILALIDVGEESWRMPWAGAEQYIRQVRESERPNTFRRLWLNEWVSSEGEFISADAWEACYSPDVRPIQPGEKVKLVLGADASTTRDLTALVGCAYNRETKLTEVRYVRVWKPQRGILRMGKPTVDLSETVGREILKLKEADQLDAVFYDPFQLHSIAVDLEKSGVRMKELPQTTGRIEADQSLYDAIIGHSIRHYNDPQLNDAIKNCIAIETPRGFRIAKEKTSLKIDAAVALSMAHYGCVQFQAGYRDATFIPNIFYGYSEMPGKMAKAGKNYVWVDEDAPYKHKPGITHENCRHRNQGCPACMAEYEAEGYYKQQDEIDQIFIENAMTPEAYKEHIRINRPISMAMGDEYKRIQTVQNFRAAVKKRMSG